MHIIYITYHTRLTKTRRVRVLPHQ